MGFSLDRLADGSHSKQSKACLRTLVDAGADIRAQDHDAIAAATPRRPKWPARLARDIAHSLCERDALAEQGSPDRPLSGPK